jgi:hypothetical protein
MLSLILPFSVKNIMPQPTKIYKDLSNPEVISRINFDLKNKSGIYGIFNDETNKIYVGNAQELAKRLKEHIYSDKSNICLKRSISKYGLKTFSIIIFEIYTESPRSLKICSKFLNKIFIFRHSLAWGGDGKIVLHPLVNEQSEDKTLSLTDLETLYIQSFNPDNLFNFKYDAVTMAGNKHTEEALVKMRERNKKENHPPPETRQCTPRGGGQYLIKNIQIQLKLKSVQHRQSRGLTPGDITPEGEKEKIIQDLE